MAKVLNNVMVRGLNGGLGEQVVLRHMRDGSTVVAKMPGRGKGFGRGRGSGGERGKKG